MRIDSGSSVAHGPQVFLKARLPDFGSSGISCTKPFFWEQISITTQVASYGRHQQQTSRIPYSVQFTCSLSFASKMTQFLPSALSYSTLDSKIVVLTGGANGIGAATVRILHSHGCKVVFGDLNVPASEAFVSEFGDDNRVDFLRCDAAKYQDVLNLFKFAMEKHGKIDHAVANAGILEHGTGWFDPTLGLSGIERGEPSVQTLEVNLHGVLIFSHIALQYLAHGPRNGMDDKSLTMLCSLAGFMESPGIFTYTAAKHGVLGLMRGLRLYVPEAFPGIRVNVVCPSATRTSMLAAIEEMWIASKMPVSEPTDVARCITAICAAGTQEGAFRYDGDVSERKSAGAMKWRNADGKGGSVHGRAIYTSGEECWDIEENLDRTRNLWLGGKPSEDLMMIQDLFMQKP